MKTKTQHTPGPWIKVTDSKPCSDGPFLRISIGHHCDSCSGPEICSLEAAHTTHEADEVTRANARLIAAAPNLLAQLKRVLAMHESGNNGAYNGEAILSESVANEIRDAIAKAEGK